MAADFEIAQITNTPSSLYSMGNPAISGDGTLIAFESTDDLTGGNADHNYEIFLYDTRKATLIQVTNSTSGGSFGGSLYASISGDGSLIAFESNANLTGENADGSFEVFTYSTKTGRLSQLTNTVGRTFAISASVNEDGSRIAYQSNGDPTGNNADGNVEIFLLEIKSRKLTQVTRTVGNIGSSQPSISGDGERIAFSSDANLTGGNAAGNLEVFVYDVKSRRFTQITQSSFGYSHQPTISGDGNWIAFESYADLTGGNSDGSFEVFLYDVKARKLSQVTDSIGGQSTNPSISHDGKRIAFESTADLTGGNVDGSTEVFLYDVGARKFTQLTDAPFRTASGQAAINADGDRVAFMSNANLTGGNPDRNYELFLASQKASPSKQIESLRVQVEALRKSGDLTRNQARLLTAQLEEALEALARNRTETALSELREFTGFVGYYVDSRILSRSVGRALIDAASQVIDQLER